MDQYVNMNTINIVGAVVIVGLSVYLAYSTITKNSSFARAFSDRNESVGIPKTARVRFKLDAGEGGQHA